MNFAIWQLDWHVSFWSWPLQYGLTEQRLQIGSPVSQITSNHSHYFVQVTQQIVETGASVQKTVFEKSANTLKIITNFYKKLPSKLSALSHLNCSL